MLNGFCNVAIDRDLTNDILKSLNDLAKKNVCIGVPDSTKHGSDDVSNAELMYIHTNGARETSMINEMQHNLDGGMPYSEAHELYVHENGSPLWNIPPRPILEPAIENNKEQISKAMKDVALDALEGKDVIPGLHDVGLKGESICKDWFTDPRNNWAPNSKETIKRKGSERPLVDKGDLKNSIKHVIKDGE